jgi:hypothetical protein
VEAAFVAERRRLEALLQQAGREDEDEDGDAEDGGVGVRYVRIKPCADPEEEAAVRTFLCVVSLSACVSYLHTNPTHTAHPPHPKSKTRTQIRAQLITQAGAAPLAWSPPHDQQRAWVLPAAFRLAQFAPYKAGQIYGMDAASAAAVWALGPQPGEHVLDLCCAPGLKLSAIADALGAVGSEGSVTGVDVNRTRLHVARKVAVKYKVGRPSSLPSSSGLCCRLLCADGVTFSLGPLAPWDGGEEDVVFDSRAYDWQVGR